MPPHRSHAPTAPYGLGQRAACRIRHHNNNNKDARHSILHRDGIYDALAVLALALAFVTHSIRCLLNKVEGFARGARGLIKPSDLRSWLRHLGVCNGAAAQSTMRRCLPNAAAKRSPSSALLPPFAPILIPALRHVMSANEGTNSR